MKNIIIIYGAKSCEHDISIITACLAKGYFANHNVYCVYLDKSNRAYLVPNSYSPALHVTQKLTQRVVFLTGEQTLGLLKHGRIAKRVKIDVIVNCCHGAHGEDGTVAALCGLLNVPIVGSPIAPSSVAMDKVLTKRTLNSLGMPVVNGFEVTRQTAGNLAELSAMYRFPLIVKPNTLGSSIGVNVCRTFDELCHNVKLALNYDSAVLCEQALTDFCEFNCAAMRAKGAVVCSRVDVPTTANDLLTFEDKYLGAQAGNEKKVDVSDEVIKQVKSLTEQIYSRLGFEGVIRVDYLYDNVERKLYVNEINSIPGSLAYGLFSDVYAMTQYGDLLVNQAIADHAERARLTTSFASSVLTAGAAKHHKK